MKLFREIGKTVNKVGGGLAKGAVNVTSSVVSSKFPRTGEYLKEVGDSVIKSSQTVIHNTSHFADGSADALIGVVKKDETRIREGLGDIKESTVNTAKGIGNGLIFTGKSVGQTVHGAINRDEDQIVEGLKNIGKVGAVAALGVGVLDLIVESDVVETEELDTRNAHLDGSAHPVTEVEFESKTVVLEDGSSYSGVFPVFDSEFDATLPKETYEMSDTVHIGIANMQLYEAIQDDPGLADHLGLSPQDVENLQSAVTPEGYDWHHHEEPGKMQLIDEETHAGTGHTGGRTIWGGGTENR